MGPAFGGVSENIIKIQGHLDSSPGFPSSSCIVLYFTFWSIVHTELIFDKI